MHRQYGGRRDFTVADFSGGRASGFCHRCTSLQFLSLLEVSWRPEICAGNVDWNSNLCAVGQYGSKLLDPHANLGYRRYHDDDDNAMNIGEWLPVTATFSACFQNNHHHYPRLLRLSHDESEYDFGFMTVKVMKYLGLVKATTTGEQVPKDVPLAALDF